MIPRFSPGELAANGRDPYEKPGLFTRVTIVVLILHAALFVVPWLWFCVLKPQEKKVFVMSASLVEMPKGNSLDVPPNQPKVPVKTDLPDIPDVPTLPDQKIPELPDPPKPEPPKPEPPKPEPPKPEPPKPAPPKPSPVPKPKPKPKVKPKKPEKPKYLSADDIKKQIEQQRKNPANRKQRQKAEAARKRAARAAAKAAADRKRILDEAAAAVKQYGTPDGGSKGVPATKEFYNYIDRLTSLLYQQWDQPTSTELKKRGVFVLVTLQIGADGTLQTKNFKPSGNAVMDQSVRKLLQKLRVVPPPPGGAMTVPVKLIVSD